VLRHLVSPDEVAAIVFEPIQGEGGYVVPPPEFVQGLAQITSRHGMLLIADEVQSGVGRTGRMFAVEHSDVRPDIVVLAKGIASGLPMGLTVAREDVMAAGRRAFQYVQAIRSHAQPFCHGHPRPHGLMVNAAAVGATCPTGSGTGSPPSADRRRARLADDRH
jgi:4-aminobutyrate aminotransferase-like enzyme